MAVFTAILGGRFYNPHLREEADAPGQCGSRRHGHIWKRRRQVLFKPQEGEQAGYRVPQRCLFPLEEHSVRYALGGKEVSPAPRTDKSSRNSKLKFNKADVSKPRALGA